MRTTIQVSDELRKRLKVLASEQDIPYENALNELIEVFEAFIPFRNEREFAKFFEKNLGVFGFEKILEKRPKGYPDYRLSDKNGAEIEVELELIAKNFRHHRHDPKKADLIVCVFSNENEILGVPVISLINVPENKEDIIKYRRNDYTTVSLPAELAKKLREDIKGTGFKNVTDYVTFVLREIAANRAKYADSTTEDDKEAVVEKLRALGYIK